MKRGKNGIWEKIKQLSQGPNSVKIPQLHYQ